MKIRNRPPQSRLNASAASGLWRAFTETFAVCVFIALTSVLPAQTNLLLIDYQWADAVTGPWTKPLANQAYVQPDGSIVTLATNGEKYFQLTIQKIDFDDVQTPAVHVEHLRDDTVSIAENHLQALAALVTENGSDDPDSQGWTNARLAEIAYKVFDPAYRDGMEPAYIEFKVVSKDVPATTPIGFLENKEEPPPCNLGYILVSMHEGEAPVPQFSQQGATLCEGLLARVGATSNIKIMRYSPMFMAVENERGELLANEGTDPFRLPNDLFDGEPAAMGEFDSETATDPPANGYGGPTLNLAPYTSYAAFKDDYMKSPIYEEFRRRKAQAIAPEWMILRGEIPPEPPVIVVRAGQITNVFAGQLVARFFLDDDEEQELPLATINRNAGGAGLTIRGERVGAAPFTVEVGGQVTHYELQVAGTPGVPLQSSRPKGNGFMPGWQKARVWVAGDGWDEQPRYWQTLDSDWCPKVGCGPVAWAILCAWWDRKGVPACFYSNIPGDFTIADAPFRLSQHPFKMARVYRDLHDYCDVICFGLFSDSGASAPGDMVEGGPSYLWIPKTFGRLDYKYVWAWDLNDPDWNQPSSRVRFANKSGRPAIVGLGWLWHYAVSYAYAEQDFKLTENGPVIFRKRLFKCNTGWQSSNPGWYSGGDTFLGAYIKPVQR